MTNEEIARFFNDSQAYIQGNPDLRDPQAEGWFRRGVPLAPEGNGPSWTPAFIGFSTFMGPAHSIK